MNAAIWKLVELVAASHHVGPVVEFGSKQVLLSTGIKCDLREHFPNIEYIGCDLSEGPGVDRIADWTVTAFDEASIGTLLACEVLEHCLQPAQAIAETYRALKPDGLALITTPFFHPIHHMPDYWRFTPQGMIALLDGQGFNFKVYFQGDLALPYAVYALAAKEQSIIDEVSAKMEERFYEIPAPQSSETIYLWTSQKDYSRMRLQRREAELALGRQFPN